MYSGIYYQNKPLFNIVEHRYNYIRLPYYVLIFNKSPYITIVRSHFLSLSSFEPDANLIWQGPKIVSDFQRVIEHKEWEIHLRVASLVNLDKKIPELNI